MQISADDLRRSYDLIVVGSGPAGLTLTRRYDDLTTASRTLIVESGARTNMEGKAQRLSMMEVSGDIGSHYYAFHSQRVYGGTSSIWTGWCAVLEKRAFLNGEWPIAYDELQAYYPQAADVLGLPREIWEHSETPLPGSANLVYRPYYITKRMRFDGLFQDLVDGNNSVDVLFDHTVTNVRIKDGVASSVSIRKSSAESIPPLEIFGNRIVLACGGIQNARLLQLSFPRDTPPPIGSYFAQHPHIIGYCRMILDSEMFDEIKIESAPGYKVNHAIALSSGFSLSNHLQSVTFGFGPGKEHRRSSRLLARNRFVVETALAVRAEMPSLERNLVTLSSSHKDFFGQPIARIAFKFEDAMENIRTVQGHVNTELIRSGLGRLSVPRAQDLRNGGGHMMGTTRMGNDPAVSVTDANARVHGMQNLYIAGSSLFPAAGSANPTLTILALSFRLADHLAGRLK